MRLFIGLDLPVILCDWLEGYARQLAKSPPASLGRLRWTPREQWHITLRFLGECPESRVAELSATLQDTAKSFSAFELSLGKPGTFSGPGGSALWVGVDEGEKTVSKLVAHLQPGKHTFRAHVTLARARNKIDSRTLRTLPAAQTPSPKSFVDRLTLFESHLGPSGARYVRLAEARFAV